jgi:fatty-acyl-CoA synthase
MKVRPIIAEERRPDGHSEFAPSAIFMGLMRSARQSPHAVAITYKERDWTYDQLTDAALAAAAKMVDSGLGVGDRVACLGRNSSMYAIGWLGTQAIGAIHVPLNFMLGPEEVRHILQRSRANMFVFDSEFKAVAQQAAAELDVRTLELSTLDDGESRWEQSITPTGARSQPAQLAYTSGTESTPKGALLTDTGLIYEYLSCIHVGEYQREDVVVNALPLYHCAQMHCFLMPHLFLGSRNIILDRADAAEIIDTIEKYQASSFFAPPTVWIGVLNHAGFSPERLKSLTKAYYGASAMPVEVLRSLCKALPWLRLWNYYGQTEIGPLAAALRPEEIDARPGAAGRPVLFVETRVVDDDMIDVPVGQVGEIVHRSPQLMREYFDDAARTAEAFRGGWFHSGDLGYMDTEGYLSLIDRKKDMIKSGGENVSSREVEEVIYGHPAVAEVAVVGLSDSKWIEAVAAVIVPHPNSRVTAVEIISWCSKMLASYKRPKRVFFVDELPKNPSGKILKRELRLSLEESATKEVISQ